MYFLQDCQMYPIVGSLGSYFRSAVKNMFWEKVYMYFLQDCQMYPIVGSLGSYFRSAVKNMF
jgi:hypothetical protein